MTKIHANETFLSELAAAVYKQHQKLEDVTVVFPNRRAILYFRKHLSSFLQKPAFSPTLLTIEEFIRNFSPLRIPEKLELIHELFIAYREVVNHADNEDNAISSFDRFFFWGEMLLRDFDEIDKYMVDASMLFKDLSHQKELDSTFDYLTEEQKKFLQDFWGGFDETDSINKKKFLHLWRRLPHVYQAFQLRLRNQGIGYEGMVQRDVATQPKSTGLSFNRDVKALKFAGFNALTAVEETILSYFVEQGAMIHWDLDTYYVNNVTQEAGKFFREYQEHSTLRKTFPSDIPSHLVEKSKSAASPRVKIYGAAQPIGQVKLMAQKLNEEIQQGLKVEETLIVLPDENLLMPVLHGVSSSIEKLNVTMGYPLSNTPFFNFIELLVDLQIQQKKDHFNHRQVLTLLGHPYVVTADPVSANSKRKEILKNNWVHIPISFLANSIELHRIIFKEIDLTQSENPLFTIIDYLQKATIEVGALPLLHSLDKEFAFQFHSFFNQLKTIFQNSRKSSEDTTQPVQQWKSFLRLFRQLIRSHKIPFAGEPLSGLQVMGVLETRNLDFKNVFILSLNEGKFPGTSSKGSYIPFAIRNAYKLPTFEHQDAIYSYLFYRVLQRADNINIFYNSETDVLGQGEMSRYLQQLIFESGIPIEKKVLHNTLSPTAVKSIEIEKNESVMEALLKVNEGNKHFRGISPSALNTYIECQLRFYFRHVAKIKEADEIEEELDARVLGNLLHDVMERYYKQITLQKESKEIVNEDYLNYHEDIKTLIDKVFIETYGLDPAKPVVYEGQRLVVREVVQRFAHRIIEIDREYTPFTIEGLEQEGLTFSVSLDKAPYNAIISGKIDRVDRKENIVRVIDYKTGKDKLAFDSVASLFSRDTNRNKAAFQTLLYALLYQKNFLRQDLTDVKLMPGLINRLNLFDDGFSFGLRFGKDQLIDVQPLLPDFEAHLKKLLEELFDPSHSFKQTSNADACKICSYRDICYR